MKHQVHIFGLQNKEEAEEARKKCQQEFCKWAAVVEDPN
ncbi:Uncharacterised protein [uncultured archaeon]|nr:Uncharacterised protein [uncultured archaeon]